MPGWSALYLAGDVALSAWMLRDEFRRRGRAAFVATMELLGSVCLALPAFTYLDKDVAALFDDAALWSLFVVGLATLACFGWRDVRKSLADPRTAWLPRRRRWLITALGPGMMLAASIPEVWWGGLALAH
ncbi:hypothetical protein HAV22_10255 [Massilia sp. TW-1]|uniref:Uncharacterized protein n=1 Tax=Telluria antibiotica TaxID=2717319 RepID=A0ABX0PAU2_9BURK|nr:hypothetical protein [Telluria antibiotica]NIA54026.1 hypothetical protein [Telluria antibiotica]